MYFRPLQMCNDNVVWLKDQVRGYGGIETEHDSPNCERTLNHIAAQC